MSLSRVGACLQAHIELKPDGIGRGGPSWKACGLAARGAWPTWQERLDKIDAVEGVHEWSRRHDGPRKGQI
jgi:hypothetical protein